METDAKVWHSSQILDLEHVEGWYFVWSILMNLMVFRLLWVSFHNRFFLFILTAGCRILRCHCRRLIYRLSFLLSHVLEFFWLILCI
jgi:hypothetical protein